MRFLVLFVLLLIMGLGNNVQAYQKSDWLLLGTMESSVERGEDRHTRENNTSFSDRGRLFGSFRRTAARLQEYDGLTPTGDLDREGLDWNRQPISQTQKIKEGTRPGFPTRWAKKVSIPDTASEYLMFFTIKNCRPCRRMYPIIEALENEGYEVYVVKRALNLNLVKQYNVSSFPTILIFDNGQMVKRMGLTTKATILRYLKKSLPPNPFDPEQLDHLAYDFVDNLKYRLW